MHDVQENFKKIMYNRFDANKVSCVSRETPQYLNQIDKIRQNAEMKNRPDADSDYAYSDSSGNNSDNDELNQIKKFQNRTRALPFSQQIDESEEDSSVSSQPRSDQSSRVITHGSNLNDQSHFVDIQKAVAEDKIKTNETIQKSQAKNKGATKVEKNKKKYSDIKDATQNESQFMGLITDTNLPYDDLDSKEPEQKNDDRYQMDIFENEAPENNL